MPRTEFRHADSVGGIIRDQWVPTDWTTGQARRLGMWSALGCLVAAVVATAFATASVSRLADGERLLVGQAVAFGLLAVILSVVSVGFFVFEAVRRQLEVIRNGSTDPAESSARRSH